eukprot:scaffold265380_cov28-Tisochrysis_lutea.AAC.3
MDDGCKQDAIRRFTSLENHSDHKSGPRSRNLLVAGRDADAAVAGTRVPVPGTCASKRRQPGGHAPSKKWTVAGTRTRPSWRK